MFPFSLKHSIWRVGTTHCQLGKGRGRPPEQTRSVSEVDGKRYNRTPTQPEVIAHPGWVRELPTIPTSSPLHQTRTPIQKHETFPKHQILKPPYSSRLCRRPALPSSTPEAPPLSAGIYRCQRPRATRAAIHSPQRLPPWKQDDTDRDEGKASVSCMAVSSPVLICYFSPYFLLMVDSI